jgi:hypothetical protein
VAEAAAAAVAAAAVAVATATAAAPAAAATGGATSPPANLPSIVVCPATLTAHWRAEATKLCGSDGLCVLEYGGSAQQRARLRSRVHEVELVAMSYETLRTDIDTLAQVGDHRTTAQSDCSLIAL